MSNNGLYNLDVSNANEKTAEANQHNNVTIKELAQRLQLSVATVSKALNNYSDVSEVTRNRVLKMASEIGYNPNFVGRSLQRIRTNTLGIIIPQTDTQSGDHEPEISHDPYFLDLISGITDQAGRIGFDLMFIRCPRKKEMQTYQQVVRNRRVDGLIVVRTEVKDERIEYLLRENFPFVAYGHATDNVALDFPFVDVDNKRAVYEGVSHLIHLGHRRIGFIGAPLRFTFGYDRLEGYKQAIAELKMESGSSPEPDSDLVIIGNLSQAAGAEAMQQLLSLPQPPTAVFVCNNAMAIGAIHAIEQAGLKVGSQIAMVGFDDNQWAEVISPKLTAVRQPIYNIGLIISRMLIAIISGNPPAETKVMLPPSLVVRESSGADIATT